MNLKRLNQQKVTQDIILETIEAYYNVLVAEKSLRSYKDNLESVSERSNATIKEYAVGLASKTDVAQAEAYLNSAKIDLLDSEIILKNLKNSFFDLVGVDAINLIFSEINVDIPNSFEEFKDILRSRLFAKDSLIASFRLNAPALLLDKKATNVAKYLKYFIICIY